MVIIMNNDIKETLLNFNLNLIEYIDNKNVIVEDNVGYKYKINIYKIKLIWQHRDKKPTKKAPHLQS